MRNGVFLAAIVASFLAYSANSAPLRIVSYNVKYLSACVKHVRKEALAATFSLDADVLALQEVRDQHALTYFFPIEEWNVVIDHESTDDQNLAFVIRKGIPLSLASGNTEDADPVDFLFRHSSNFPDKRDVLRVFLHPAKLNYPLELLNHHAKSM